MQNVLHWHIVDTQSFPLEIPSFPNLWFGAYSKEERYTIADAKEIVRWGTFSFECATQELVSILIYFLSSVDMLSSVESVYWLKLMFQDMHYHGNYNNGIELVLPQPN